jgi:Putative adhesin
MAEYAAPQADLGQRNGRTLRARLSVWAVLVAASTAILLAAVGVLSIWWAATYDRDTSSITAQLPSTLLGIELTVARGDVEIVAGNPEEVLVSRTAWSAYGRQPAERRSILDGVLTIESSCASLVLGKCAADYRLTVPENVPVTVSAARGDVHLNAYRGSARVSTEGGSISAEAFCGFLLHAEAKGGDIDVAAACSPERIELRTDSGDVRVAVPQATYSIDADTNGGRLAVRGLEHADGAPFAIQALSGSGDVTVEAGS